MYGKRNDEIIRDFLGADLDDAEVFAHGAAEEELYRELMRPRLESALVPGVREFFARHSDLAMALATNAEPANVDLVLEGTGVRPFFHAIVNGHEVVNPKPHPEIYLRAAVFSAPRHADTVVFEDSYTGVEAGLAAGMRVVGVTTTHHDLPGVSLAIADFRDPGARSLASAGRGAWSGSLCYTAVDTKR